MEKLAAGLEKLGIKAGERELALFQIYYEELTDWNQRMNLTAITEYEKVQTLHFLDSLTVAAVWRPTESKPHPRVIDIGTGAGVPGIPLKIIFPQIRLTLMDSTNKKITFLNHLKQKLGLNDIEVISGRAEELARQQYREIYDLVLARGLAQCRRWQN
jgi:16S rRNA (guanine527-N7)-methyltransferase